jgi:hypothetical protein
VEFFTPEWYTNRVVEDMKEQGGVPGLSGYGETGGSAAPNGCGSAPLFLYTSSTEGTWKPWYGFDEVARYDYLYHDNELEAGVDWIKRIVVQATYCQQEQVMVYYFSGSLNYPHSLWGAS